jgi:hypothetical protein
VELSSTELYFIFYFQFIFFLKKVNNNIKYKFYKMENRDFGDDGCGAGFMSLRFKNLCW